MNKATTTLDVWRIKSSVGNVTLHSTNYFAWFGSDGIHEAFNRLNSSDFGKYIIAVERLYMVGDKKKWYVV